MNVLNCQKDANKKKEFISIPYFASEILDFRALWDSYLCQTNIKCFPFFFSEIPIWLRVYFKASPTLDHHLKWELFRLPELECFEGMLSRLFREELEDLVRR